MGEHVRGFVDVSVRNNTSGNETTLYIVISGDTNPTCLQTMVQKIKQAALDCNLTVTEIP